MEDPSSLRQQAARCRRILAELTDAAARESLSRLAEEYERRSNNAEHRQRSSRGPSATRASDVPKLCLATTLLWA